jgi:hypothetical protein
MLRTQFLAVLFACGLMASTGFAQNVDLWRMPDALRTKTLESQQFETGTENAVQPYIRNGIAIDASVYPSVVAIKYRGKPYCTGVVIGPRQILTAGHCVFQYRNTLKNDLSYEDAADVTQTGVGQQLCGYVLPQAPIAYDPSSYSHDLGLIFTTGTIGLPIAILPGHMLDWEKIVNSKTLKPVFVGYGLYSAVSDPNQALGPGGAGVKRKAVISITMADNWNFYYNSGLKPSKSTATCSGDSGGPTILGDHIIGVTSVGDKTCTVGASTRLDVYQDWITKNKDLVDHYCR